MAGHGVELNVRADCPQAIHAGPFFVTVQPVAGGMKLGISVETPLMQQVVVPGNVTIVGRMYRLPELYERSEN